MIRRRRRCLGCDKRFTTYERAEVSLPATEKKDGSRVEFDLAKLRASMQLALRKRPVSTEQLDAALDRIPDKLRATGAREVSSARVGELVMRELKGLDKVANVRYASVYRQFEDIARVQPADPRDLSRPGAGASPPTAPPPIPSSEGRANRPWPARLCHRSREDTDGTPPLRPISHGLTLAELLVTLALAALLLSLAQPFSTYSLGMKQRLAIAGTLIGQPDVLIFDEPTNGLDPQGIAEVRTILKKIADSGKTVIMASHILDEVEKICSHVAIIKKGNLLATSPIGSIINSDITVELAATDMAQLKTFFRSIHCKKSEDN